MKNWIFLSFLVFSLTGGSAFARHDKPITQAPEFGSQTFEGVPQEDMPSQEQTTGDWSSGTMPSGSMPGVSGTTQRPVGTSDELTRLNVIAALYFIHHLNNLEMMQAREAMDRLETQEARNYAQTLINDHETLDQQVVQVATEKNVTLMSFQPSNFEVAINTQLKMLTGTDFERGFFQIQEQCHERALQALEQMRTTITDPQVMSLITQTIPVIERHRDEIRNRMMNESMRS